MNRRIEDLKNKDKATGKGSGRTKTIEDKERNKGHTQDNTQGTGSTSNRSDTLTDTTSNSKA